MNAIGCPKLNRSELEWHWSIVVNSHRNHESQFESF